MIAWLKVIGCTLVLGVASTIGSRSVPAATSASLDILSSETANEPAGAVELGRLKPVEAGPNQSEKLPPRGNPLWSIPLSALSATRERPVFSASRRPPQAAVAARTTEAGGPAPPRPAERPSFALIGAVVGEGDAIAILLDQTSQKIVRLRQGESLAGWELSSVQRREVMLKQAERIEILALPRPDDRSGSPGAPVLLGTAGVPDLALPAAGGPFFAPFVPRSTSKNAEPGGL
jgi:general secretion pathway protein N